MNSPRVSSIIVDWDALAPELEGLDEPSATQSRPREETKSPFASAPNVTARINLATGDRFPNIATSPVPVLLPFDTPAFLRDHAAAAYASQTEAGNYLSGFNSVAFFPAGPSGYDAVLF